METTIRLGKVLGIPVGINYSWLFIFVLVIFLMSSRFAEAYPYWATAPRWALAVVTTLFFFLSVLAHELSHSLVAISRGIPVRGITLFIFGGISQLDHEAERPTTELLVAVVGPLASLLLAGVCAGLYLLTYDMSRYLGAFFFTLGAVNVSLGIFNLLPGFPLDGGRVLRAAIWWGTGNYWRATQIASRGGQGLGLLMVAGGAAWAVLWELQGIWIALVGGFLFFVATANYRQERLRESLKSLRVGDFVSQTLTVLPAETPAMAQPTLEALRQSGLVAVSVGNLPVGIATVRQLAGLTPAQWRSCSLGDVMTPLGDEGTLEADAPVVDAMDWMDRERLAAAPVRHQGILVGLVIRSHLSEVVRAARNDRK